MPEESRPSVWSRAAASPKLLWLVGATVMLVLWLGGSYLVYLTIAPASCDKQELQDIQQVQSMLTQRFEGGAQKPFFTTECYSDSGDAGVPSTNFSYQGEAFPHLVSRLDSWSACRFVQTSVDEAAANLGERYYSCSGEGIDFRVYLENPGIGGRGGGYAALRG